jgi:hypothetical protein
LKEHIKRKATGEELKVDRKESTEAQIVELDQYEKAIAATTGMKKKGEESGLRGLKRSCFFNKCDIVSARGAWSRPLSERGRKLSLNGHALGRGTVERIKSHFCTESSVIQRLWKVKYETNRTFKTMSEIKQYISNLMSLESNQAS